MVICRQAPVAGVYTEDVTSDNQPVLTPCVPVRDYAGFIRPSDDAAACRLGDVCAKAVWENIIADFERGEAYCARNHEPDPDLMVHVSTFVILDGMVYMTYYANRDTSAEDHSHQAARLAFCPLCRPEEMVITEIQKVGDMLDGRQITRLYDTILMYKGGEELYILWTASPEDNYYRLYCTFNLATRTFGPIQANRFRVGQVTNDFSMSGMQAALTCAKIPYKPMWTDIGIMQKISSREENGQTWYYTGAYSGNFNCIIKSTDFVTWEYVATPDFENNSRWENATYVLDDQVYYFVRQQECEQGFLTRYDLTRKTWEKPVLIADAQSRSDFILFEGELYLIHAPVDRNGFGIVRINRESLKDSEVILVADMKDSLFYPYVRLYGEEIYMSYTVARKHIRLSKFNLKQLLALRKG